MNGTGWSRGKVLGCEAGDLRFNSSQEKKTRKSMLITQHTKIHTNSVYYGTTVSHLVFFRVLNMYNP